MTATRTRLTVLLAAIVIVLTACGSSGAPNAYTEQPVAFESINGEESEVPLVEANYREACERSDPGAFDSDDRTVQYCECTYNKYVELVPYDVFVAFNDEIADNADDINSGQALQRAYRSAVEKVEEETGEPVETVANILDVIEIPCT
ncbi:MAG: hypothetical protein ACR2QE_12820 [Acidimicrobiales bacterium]